MTLDGARETARNAAVRFGVPWIVWRMPKWPEGVYGARAESLGVPDNATVERFTSDPAPIVTPAAQGSLF